MSNSGSGLHGRRRKLDSRPASGRRVGAAAALAAVVVIVLLLLLF